MLTPYTLKMDERMIDQFKNNSNKLMTVKYVSSKIYHFLNNSDIRYEHDINL